jgi:hypothetical protein
VDKISSTPPKQPPEQKKGRGGEVSTIPSGEDARPTRRKVLTHPRKVLRGRSEHLENLLKKKKNIKTLTWGGPATFCQGAQAAHFSLPGLF